MLKIKPFRGIIYNQEKVGNLEKVIAPPYDVISKKEQEIYYKSHPYNIIRIILGKDLPGDNSKENKYTRAAKTFRDWLSSGILKEEKDEAIYVYTQEYSLQGERKKRKGFLALMKLEEFGEGKVFPHEKTFSGPKEDRLRLLRACRANLSPIFSLYSDPSYIIDKYLKGNEPFIKLTDKNGIYHELGRIKNSLIIKEILEEMKDKKIFIADGHHRYLTALKFSEEEGKRFSEENENFVMVYFSNMEQESMTILPTYRLINFVPEKKEEIKEKLKEFFSIKTIGFSPKTKEKKMREMLNEINKNRQNYSIMGMHCKEEKYYLLTLKERHKTLEWEVDTAVLDKIIKKLMGKENLKKGEEIEFIRDEKKAVDYIDKGKYQMAFFLKPTSLERVKKISLAGKVMPPKSTYFYPKLITGLVMRDLKG